MISDAEIVLTSSSGDRDVASSGTDGRFTVRVPRIGETDEDSLTVDHRVYSGTVVSGNLTTTFDLQPGKNLMVIELPRKAPCPLPKKTDEAPATENAASED